MAAGRGTILVVDDDADVRDALLDALEDEGYGVAQAGDGQQALRWLGEHEAPALILLDWLMPRMAGAELCERLAADPKLSRIPVVVLTADRLATGGRAGHLSKPVRLEELLAALRLHAGDRSLDFGLQAGELS